MIKSISHLIGTKINRWTILEDLGRINKIRKVMALCDCGTKRELYWGNVQSNKSQSCGCLPIEINTIHGLHRHPLYCTWEGMIDRCYNENYRKFERYGGRGVEVCTEWRHDPKAFYEWAINNGWKKGLHLDKDKLSPNRLGKLYCPEYCCFLTAKENSMYRGNSRVIEHNGETMCVAQWADRFNINYQTFQARLRYGWSVEDILSIPISSHNKKHKKLAS